MGGRVIMSDIDILRELIKPGAIVPLTLIGSKYSVTLREPDCPESSVTICGLPEHTVVIKADIFTAPKAIFANIKHECKRADFIIVAEVNSTKKRILHVEIKKGVKENSDVIKQLAGTFCLARYCQEIGKHFWRTTTFLDCYQHRFVSFMNAGLGLRPSRPEASPLNDKPERMLRILSPHKPQFNHLVGS